MNLIKTPVKTGLARLLALMSLLTLISATGCDLFLPCGGTLAPNMNEKCMPPTLVAGELLGELEMSITEFDSPL